MGFAPGALNAYVNRRKCLHFRLFFFDTAVGVLTPTRRLELLLEPICELLVCTYI